MDLKMHREFVDTVSTKLTSITKFHETAPNQLTYVVGVNYNLLCYFYIYLTNGKVTSWCAEFVIDNGNGYYEISLVIDTVQNYFSYCTAQDNYEPYIFRAIPQTEEELFQYSTLEDTRGLELTDFQNIKRITDEIIRKVNENV